MRRAAAEAGYLPEDSTIADFLDLVGQDLRARSDGNAAARVFADGDFERAEGFLNEEARIEEIDRAVGGLDLSRFPSLEMALLYAESQKDLSAAIDQAYLDQEFASRVEAGPLQLSSSPTSQLVAARGARPGIYGRETGRSAACSSKNSAA